MAERREMEIFAGFMRASAGKRRVEILGGVAGRITCLECDGSGTWPFIDLSSDMPEEACVPCKGTGKILVSI